MHPRFRVLVLIPLIAALASLGLAAESGKRVALVIGNAAYGSAPLRNPANDATDMSAALRKLGFSVYAGTDASRKSMFSLIDKFSEDLGGADIALFYYSGHGVQMNGENYLIPVGADVSAASDIESEGVQLQRIIGRMTAAKAATSIVILDACRNNPFPTATRGLERGLSTVEHKPPESVIVYATEANETAEDGSGRNGVFTAALLKHIAEDAEFTAVLRAVNAEVRNATGQKQKPAKYDNLTHEVYLSGRPGASPSAPSVAVAPANAPTVTVTRAYGGLSVGAATAGTLYLDGARMIDLPGGAKAKIDSVNVGNRRLEMRYADGQVESQTVDVSDGQVESVSFYYVPAPKSQPQATPSAGSKILVLDSIIPTNMDPAVIIPVTDNIILEFIKSSRYTVLDRGNAAAVLKEGNITISSARADEDALRAGKCLAADYVVFSKLAKVGDTCYLSGKIIAIKTGRIIRSYSVQKDGKLSTFISLAGQFGAALANGN